MHILFLSADTGGGHRASAEALAKQVRFSKTQRALFYGHMLDSRVEFYMERCDAMQCDAIN